MFFLTPFDFLDRGCETDSYWDLGFCRVFKCLRTAKVWKKATDRGPAQCKDCRIHAHEHIHCHI